MTDMQQCSCQCPMGYHTAQCASRRPADHSNGKVYVQRVILGNVRYRVISDGEIIASFSEKRKATAKAKRLNKAYAIKCTAALRY